MGLAGPRRGIATVGRLAAAPVYYGPSPTPVVAAPPRHDVRLRPLQPIVPEISTDRITGLVSAERSCSVQTPDAETNSIFRHYPIRQRDLAAWITCSPGDSGRGPRSGHSAHVLCRSGR